MENPEVIAFIVCVILIWLLCMPLVSGIVAEYCDTGSRTIDRCLYVLGMLLAPVVGVVILAVGFIMLMLTGGQLVKKSFQKL